jgi:hypothetical protein
MFSDKRYINQKQQINMNNRMFLILTCLGISLLSLWGVITPHSYATVFENTFESAGERSGVVVANVGNCLNTTGAVTKCFNESYFATNSSLWNYGLHMYGGYNWTGSCSGPGTMGNRFTIFYNDTSLNYRFSNFSMYWYARHWLGPAGNEPSFAGVCFLNGTDRFCIGAERGGDIRYLHIMDANTESDNTPLTWSDGFTINTLPTGIIASGNAPPYNKMQTYKISILYYADPSAPGGYTGNIFVNDTIVSYWAVPVEMGNKTFNGIGYILRTDGTTICENSSRVWFDNISMVHDMYLVTGAPPTPPSGLTFNITDLAGVISTFTTVIFNPIVFWAIILVGVSAYVEYKVRSGGKVFALILFLGVLILAVLGIFPAWIPIIFILIGGLIIFKLFAGGK